MTYPSTIRPRPGDLEAACQPHEAIPSGEYAGPTEVCDLCGLAVRNTLMHTPTRPAPTSTGAGTTRDAGERAGGEG